MDISKSAVKLKALIEKAIEDHRITRKEYDTIISLASEDGNIDVHEKALLAELHGMIEDKSVKMVP